MNFSFPGAYPNQHIELTFNTDSFITPDFVLVFAFHQKKLLFTHHRERGWELPGGICKPCEWPMLAAIREVYEETGAELDSLLPIGQYIMSYPGQEQQAKTVYVARIRALHNLPSGFETDDIQLIDPPDPDSILDNSDFSLLLKDKVYQYSLPVAIYLRDNLNKSYPWPAKQSM